MKPDLKESTGDSGAQPAGGVHAVINIDTPIGQAANRVVSVGIVVSVRGAVVDVRFVDRLLPPIQHRSGCRVGSTRPRWSLEVHSHVDAVTVRGIALQATGGLARGTQVRATMAPYPSRSGRGSLPSP
ncbi:MAG: hypothetical protein WDN50_12885 [Bradyrhizobium sp.]